MKRPKRFPHGPDNFPMVPYKSPGPPMRMGTNPDLRPLYDQPPFPGVIPQKKGPPAIPGGKKAMPKQSLWGRIKGKMPKLTAAHKMGPGWNRAVRMGGAAGATIGAVGVGMGAWKMYQDSKARKGAGGTGKRYSHVTIPGVEMPGEGNFTGPNPGNIQIPYRKGMQPRPAPGMQMPGPSTPTAPAPAPMPAKKKKKKAKLGSAVATRSRGGGGGGGGNQMSPWMYAAGGAVATLALQRVLGSGGSRRPRTVNNYYGYPRGF